MAIDIDALLAKSNGEPTEPTPDPTPTDPADPTPDPVDPNPEPEPVPTDPTPDPDPVDPEPAPEPVDPEPDPIPEPTPPAELNLDEYEVEVNGESRSVNSLLQERDQLAERVAKIDSNEFLKGFLDHYEATGDATAYLEAKAIDWDKQDDLSVLSKQFDKENSDLDQATRDMLFQDELQNKYKIDLNASPEEIDTESQAHKIGQALLKRDATKARTNFKEQQAKFVIPEVKRKAAESAADPKVQQETWKKQLGENVDLAKFRESKLLEVAVEKEDGTKFGYEVENPDSIIEMMVDDRQFWKLFINDKGVVDHSKQAKVYAFAKNPAAYEKQLVEFGKTLAVEKTLKEKRNTDGNLDDKTKLPAVGSGDWRDGFLQAAKQQKKS